MTPTTPATTAMTIVKGNELSSAAKQRTDIKRNANIQILAGYKETSTLKN